MKLKRHSPEQIIRKLRTADQLLNQGQNVAESGVHHSCESPPLRQEVQQVGRRCLGVVRLSAESDQR